MTNCEKCAPYKCGCDKNVGKVKCHHPKEALIYCFCCDKIKCHQCGKMWCHNEYTVTYYPLIFAPAPYVPVTPYDPDPPFYYTTCGCDIGDS